MRAGIRPDNLLERAALATGQAPEPLFDAYVGLMTARAIMAGHRLGVFDAVADQPDDAAGLARRLDLDARGLDVLLVALHALGYLECGDGRYRPGAPARRSLLSGGRFPLRRWMEFTYDMWDAFSDLERAVRTGEPGGLHEREPDDPYWERYLRGLDDLAGLQAPDVARAMGLRSPRSLLELAGGHGRYAVELCRRHPGLHATIVELEGAARIGRQLVAEAGMEERITFLVGDLFEADLGRDHDVATAFQIVHHLEPAAVVRMLRRALGALRPGGRMVVHELERPPDGQAGDVLGALTGVLFHITSRARTYTAAELEGFLEEAGFTAIRTRRPLRAPGTVLVLGDRPG